jgi:hypothetical protein
MPNQIIKQSTLAVIKRALLETYGYHDVTDLFERHGFTLAPGAPTTNRQKRIAAYLDHLDWTNSRSRPAAARSC